MADIDQGALVAVSAAFGAGATALGRMLAGNRRTDKVDAVAAVAAAFDRVADRTSAHVDDLSEQCRHLTGQVEYLNRELRKRDELILKYLGSPEQRASAAEIAAEKLTDAAAKAAASVLTTAAERATSTGGRRVSDSTTAPEAT